MFLTSAGFGWKAVQNGSEACQKSQKPAANAAESLEDFSYDPVRGRAPRNLPLPNERQSPQRCIS